MIFSAKRILVIAGQSVRETVLAVPFLRNLREALPAARIDIAIESTSGRVIEGCPYVDSFISIEETAVHGTGSRPPGGRFTAFRRAWGMIREGRYDTAFDLKGSFSSGLLVRAAGVPRRIGFAAGGRGLLLTDSVPYRHDQHEVEDFLDCLRVLEIPIHSKALELWPSAAHEKKVSDLLRKTGWKASDLKTVIQPAACLPAKQWPLERFAAVMKALRERYNARFIYTGTAEDAPLCDELERHGHFDGLNLCGKTSIRENISLYRTADLFFGGDSGLMHMATAVGVTVVALFGPTDERKWGPWGEGHVVITKRLACRPCKPHTCKDNECMKRISVAEALDALEKKIQSIYPKVLHD
jgi:lipopolysaccharide heptosyltransferase II